MTCPFSGIREGGIYDPFNFYHSLIKIKIKCAFGVLVYRGGCLQKQLPCNLTLKYIIHDVKYLCILQNYCINKRIKKLQIGENIDNLVSNCDKPLVAGTNHIGSVNSRMDTQRTVFNNNLNCQNEFLDVGHHYDDTPTTRIKNSILEEQNIRDNENNIADPREPLLEGMQD